MNMDAPKLKRSPYLSSMVSGGNSGGWSLSSSTDDGVSDSASNSSARYHPQIAGVVATSTSSNNNIKSQQQQPPRRKLRHALNEGSSYSRDYFNLRRPKGTHTNTHGRRRASDFTSTSTGGAHSSALSIHSMLSPYINPNNNNSAVSFSSATSAASTSASAAAGHGGGKMKIQRRRRTSTSKHPTPQQLQSLQQLSSSAPLSSNPPKLQYYYPNPFSTTNLRDMIRLHQESTTEGGNNEKGGETSAVTSTSSVEAGDGSSTQPSPSPQIMNELDDDETEEMMEDVAPLNAPLYHQARGSTCGKKLRVPSCYRSLPQLGVSNMGPHNNQRRGSNNGIQQSSYNFFQQVLLDPIDGVEDDINRFKRNEGWKEIRMYADDDHANPPNPGGNAGYLNQLMVDSVDNTSSSGRITDNDGMGAGIVSDDNDGSAGEEDTATNNKGVVVQKYWKRKLSVESSTSSCEEEEEGSSPPRQLPAAGAASLRRSRNAVGAGLAYGSDTLRSYQSRSSSR